MYEPKAFWLPGLYKNITESNKQEIMTETNYTRKNVIICRPTNHLAVKGKKGKATPATVREGP
jgi:hypothetical protein